MTNKTDDQIEKEKAAVAKMIGAKSAMEVALQRISTLEREGRRIAQLSRELFRLAGDEALIRTHYHTPNGQYQSESKTVSAVELAAMIDAIEAKVFKQ